MVDSLNKGAILLTLSLLIKNDRFKSFTMFWISSTKYIRIKVQLGQNQICFVFVVVDKCSSDKHGCYCLGLCGKGGGFCGKKSHVYDKPSPCCGLVWVVTIFWNFCLLYPCSTQWDSQVKLFIFFYDDFVFEILLNVAFVFYYILCQLCPFKVQEDIFLKIWYFSSDNWEMGLKFVSLH